MSNELKQEETSFFPDKHLKKLQSLAPGFTDTIDGSDLADIRSKILGSEQSIYEIERAKENDNKLLELKKMVKEISEPYRDAKNLETAKIKYCLYVLESRGQVP